MRVRARFCNPTCPLSQASASINLQNTKKKKIQQKIIKTFKIRFKCWYNYAFCFQWQSTEITWLNKEFVSRKFNRICIWYGFTIFSEIEELKHCIGMGSLNFIIANNNNYDNKNNNSNTKPILQTHHNDVCVRYHLNSIK